jgi:hypothetical protein
MINRSFVGYAYSFITKMGKERIVMASFGTTKRKAFQHFFTQNKQKLEPIHAHKMYQVTLTVHEEITDYQKP